jgi:hypothetical protein
MTFTLDSARSIFPDTQVADAVPLVVQACNQLSAEDQLALLWFAYTEMGITITPAAMEVVNMMFAENILTQIKQMPALEQTQVMCDLVNRADTPICHTYAAFGTNVKLGFWYQLSEWMQQGIVAPIPAGYELSPTDKDPVMPPKEAAPRTHVSIRGIDNTTVLSYVDNMNAFDFTAAVALFAEDGALKPPFQEPVVGRDNILTYMRNECYGLKLLPEQGISESADGGFTQIKVTGKVQTPWFGNRVSINLAWRFLLNPEGQIFFVGIDVLASAKELLDLGLVL